IRHEPNGHNKRKRCARRCIFAPNGASVAVDDELGNREPETASGTVAGSTVACILFKHPAQAILWNGRAIILNVNAKSIDQMPVPGTTFLRGIHISSPRLP